MSRRIKTLLWVVVSLASLALILAISLWWVLFASLAKLDGNVEVSGLAAPTLIERDAQGLVTINGQSRSDIAFSLGFVHAQERLFQMDLLRRNSAGELSELFGDVAANFDSRIRLHQFRKRAEAAADALPEAHHQLLLAYANGVNEGIAQLKARPFEYLLLQANVKDWQPEDSLLVVYSMYMDLQDEWGETERSLSAMHDLLPADWFDFLVPTGGEWDATLDGGDVAFQSPLPETPLSDFQSRQTSQRAFTYQDEIEVGSNNWSVGGALTNHGAAMIANDMHLGLDVPNIWFRASWTLPEDQRRITGATLPGTPLMIVGSTEKIAWGFTNSYGDYMDIVRLQTNAEGSEYLSPTGWKAFTLEQEVINIKGATPRTMTVKKTQWGPVIGEDHFGNAIALRWVAHHPDAANLALLKFEQANTVQEAIAIAHEAGMPGQNLNVGDAEGNIGWTIMGRIPNRTGFASGWAERLQADWSTGELDWQGWLPDNQYPRLVNPDHSRLWTANARMVSGQDYRRMGDNIGAIGARQQQIRDRLFEQEQFSPSDFLALHLDDEARFLSRWHQLLTKVVNAEPLAENNRFDEFRSELDRWQGRASASSVGYLLVKRFREQVIDQSVGQVLDFVAGNASEFWGNTVDNRVEYATWALITQQPEQHLPTGYRTWSDFLAKQAATIFIQYNDPDTGLTEQTWGNHNRLAISHPMSQALPFMAVFLDMETTAMSGDTFMPRVQASDFGASERMTVAPGHEEEGYFHMATGQSGHPLSPFYRAGHEDWVMGRPSGFLPGETKYTLELKPTGSQ